VQLACFGHVCVVGTALPANRQLSSAVSMFCASRRPCASIHTSDDQHVWPGSHCSTASGDASNDGLGEKAWPNNTIAVEPDQAAWRERDGSWKQLIGCIPPGSATRVPVFFWPGWQSIDCCPHRAPMRPSSQASGHMRRWKRVIQAPARFHAVAAGGKGPGDIESRWAGASAMRIKTNIH